MLVPHMMDSRFRGNDITANIGNDIERAFGIDNK